MEYPTSILTVDLTTSKEKLLSLLGMCQNINNNLEVAVKVETEKQVAYINEDLIEANDIKHYMICMFLKYPNGIMIPYGFPPFALEDADEIVRIIKKCFELMTHGGMPVAYQYDFFTDNKLLRLAVRAMCDIQMLERALAEAEANVKKH